MTPTVALLSLGGPEMIWIFVLMLLLFGAKKLPGLARSIGESLGQFKSARDEFERELRYAELDAAREEEENAPKIEAPKEGRLEVGAEHDDVHDEYAHDDYHHDYHDYHDDHHDEDGHDHYDHDPEDAEHRNEEGSHDAVAASDEKEKAPTAATSNSSSHA